VLAGDADDTLSNDMMCECLIGGLHCDMITPLTTPKKKRVMGCDNDDKSK